MKTFLKVIDDVVCNPNNVSYKNSQITVSIDNEQICFTFEDAPYSENDCEIKERNVYISKEDFIKAMKVRNMEVCMRIVSDSFNTYPNGNVEVKIEDELTKISIDLHKFTVDSSQFLQIEHLM